MQHSLIIAPEVLRELGGPEAADAMFANAEGPFRCAVCGNLGRLGLGTPVSVVVVVVCDGGRRARNVQLAHPGCSNSKVRVVRAVASTPRSVGLPGAAWLRPADTDPPAVLVIARSTLEPTVDAASDASGSFLTRLLDHGFALLADPDTPLPHVRGLTAWHTPGQLAIHDRYGEVVWDGRLPSSHAWTYAALRSRRLGVVVASGVQLAEPGQARGLYTAITGGRAAGAAIRLADPAAATSRLRPFRPYQQSDYAAGAA